MKKIDQIKLQIEAARSQLNAYAIQGLNLKECYSCSLEMDQLVEQYLLEVKKEEANIK